MVAIERLLHIYNFIRPVLDVGILTFILYQAYDFLSKTNGVQVLKAIVIIAIGYAIAVLLDLQTLRWLLNIIAPVLVIVFVILFQPEIRKLFLKIGQGSWFAFGSRSKHTYVDAVLTPKCFLHKNAECLRFLRDVQS